ncbi:TIGR03751 family conjugal transfer lipoprotein [Aromatoleum anaerobium]|uniref:TIGR03751 family conjugal transfer lipoprotein n=1 Tax=Aromatoleum anaerobium TaxID=182180 RepID=A0ABX1PP76_9RHOO|nr:TIGR03751 family conjugal transfer lipoprotein [Aromatoleum anaerobium]MCK0508632.1 TIGR03751 family conjugal transfer lipoprotein [Aromatoleum anaerobium]
MDSTDPTCRIVLPLLAAITVTACSVAGPRASPLPAEGPTMEQIYRDRTGEADRNRAREALPLRPAEEIRPGPVRESALQQIEQRFARLENPDLIMVVFPHLAHGKYPVPAYVTAFPMYESVEYLLPGEGDGPPRPETPSVPSALGGSETTVRAPGGN